MSRLRAGERIAAGAAIALVVLLCLNWFSLSLTLPVAVPGLHQSGWASLGWFVVVLLVVVVLSVGALVAATLGGTLEQQLRIGVATAALSTLVAPVLILRVALFQPGLGVGAPNGAVSVLLPGYLGVLAAVLVTLGAWWALADERTDAPQSAYRPPQPRPVPPSAAI